MKKALFGALAVTALALGVIVPSAHALTSSDYSLFGDAAYTTPGNASDRAVTLTSDSDPGYGGVAFPVASGTTFADIGVLATDYRFAAGDSCGGGSPRFQVKVDTGSSTKNIFVYLGDSPNYTGCASNEWISSGDLITASTSVDTSQLAGGTFYDTYASATDKFGDLPVVDIKLVADASWAFDGSQIVTIDNTNIDGLVYTYEATSTGTTTPPTGTTTPSHPMTKDECKDGGWMGFVMHLFKNQGQCIKFFLHHDDMGTTSTSSMVHVETKTKTNNGRGH